MSVTDLQKLTPDFAWDKYITSIQPPAFDSLNVAMPDYVKAMNELIAHNDLETVKTYMRWQTLRAAAPVLPNAFVAENFNFYGKTLRGAKELRPRWKRCVEYTDNDLGEALGQAYVAETFPPEAKAKTLQMVHELEAALKTDITDLSWMTPDTKKQALEKLSRIDNKIGYPNQWRDLQRAQRRSRRRHGQFRARQSVRVQPPAWQDRQAGGSQRVGHDASHGECLLQSPGK